jgi:adenylate cyclase
VKARLTKPLILGSAIALTGVFLSLIPFGAELEKNEGLDILFRLRGQKTPPSVAVVVSIDKESAEFLNISENPDKWPRSLHASLTENLAREGAAVIVFDVHFIEARGVEDDRRLAKAISRYGPVVLCEPCQAKELKLTPGEKATESAHSIVKVVKPLDLLTEAAVATAPFILPRIPFKVSHYWTFQRGAGDAPTLPVMAFYLYNLPLMKNFARLLEKANPHQAGFLPEALATEAPIENPKRRLMRVREIFEQDPDLARKMVSALEGPGNLSFPTRERQRLTSLIHMFQGDGTRFLNYYGPPRTMTTLPYYQALRLRHGLVDGKKIDLRGKVVFVGLSEVLLAERKDSFYTVFSEANGLFLSGVEIMATAFSNLLEDRPVIPIGLPLFIFILLAWGILTGSLGRLFNLRAAALSILGVSMLYLLLAEYRFGSHNEWFPLIIPLFFQGPLAFFGGLGWNYLDTQKERENIKKAFEHYVPKEVVDQLAKNIATIQTGGQVVYGICLFTDAKNYTTLSETMEPAALGRFMNRYYETIFRPVKQHDGCISGVIGDAMLALWVSPSSENGLRNKACLAGLDIQEALTHFSESFEGLSLKTRIGLHCGHILLGHVGALDHYEYTPMGDIVNTASRIESLNKHLGTTLLVSAELIRELKGLLSRDLGTFKLKGKLNPISIHEVLGRMDEENEKLQTICRVFSEGLQFFHQQSWEEALEKFVWVDQDRVGDGPSRFYIRFCHQYQETPPGPSWNGVVHMDKK